MCRETSWKAIGVPVPVNPQGAIIVLDVIKAKTDPAGAIVAKVPAGCSPVRLALSPDGRTAWVTARNSNAAIAFDTAKLVQDPQHARLTSVLVGTAPVGIAVINDRVFVTNSNRFAADPTKPQTLMVIDSSNVKAGKAQVVGTIPAGAFPREFGKSPDGKTLFVANYLSNTLEVIDPARVQVTPLPLQPK